MWHSYSLRERELTSKWSIWNEIFMALTQGCGIELYKPGTTSETLRKEDTVYGIQDYSWGDKKWGIAWHWRPLHNK